MFLTKVIQKKIIKIYPIISNNSIKKCSIKPYILYNKNENNVDLRNNLVLFGSTNNNPHNHNHNHNNNHDHDFKNEEETLKEKQEREAIIQMGKAITIIREELPKFFDNRKGGLKDTSIYSKDIKFVEPYKSKVEIKGIRMYKLFLNTTYYLVKLYYFGAMTDIIKIRQISRSNGTDSFENIHVFSFDKNKHKVNHTRIQVRFVFAGIPRWKLIIFGNKSLKDNNHHYNDKDNNSILEFLEKSGSATGISSIFDKLRKQWRLLRDKEEQKISSNNNNNNNNNNNGIFDMNSSLIPMNNIPNEQDMVTQYEGVFSYWFDSDGKIIRHQLESIQPHPTILKSLGWWLKSLGKAHVTELGPAATPTTPTTTSSTHH